MRSFHFVDKSCHRRKDEVSWVRRFFLANEWTEVARLEEADCVIFFTCAEMRYKVANMLREVETLSKRVGSQSEFMVGACLPKTNQQALSRVFQGPTITPTDFTALNRLPGIKTKIEEMPPIYGNRASFTASNEPSAWAVACDVSYRLSRLAASGLRAVPSDRARSLAARLCRARHTSIYVSAGCAKKCSYCAIRFATGPVRSKPIDVVMQNISEGLRLGYRTFDFLSDSIGGYGLDLGVNLGDLLDRVLAHPGYFTIGISDLHTHEFIRFFDNIVPLCEAGRLHYLYVPVQSGNERILQRMNRPCDMKDVADKLLAIKQYPEVFLQTGVIIGFPGETEAQFEDTVRFLKRVGFDNVYVHYYCDMPNTVASGLPDKTDKATMIERLEKIGRSGVRFNLAKTRAEWESTLALS
jgi:tRNA A37 methylthiotransferase MiaB